VYAPLALCALRPARDSLVVIAVVPVQAETGMVSLVFPDPYVRPAGSPVGGHRIRRSWTHASFSGVPALPIAVLRVGWVGALPALSFQVAPFQCDCRRCGASELTACVFLPLCFDKKRVGPAFMRETGAQSI